MPYAGGVADPAPKGRTGFGALTTPLDIQAACTISPDTNEASILLTDFRLHLRPDASIGLRAFGFQVALGEVPDRASLQADIRGGVTHSVGSPTEELVKFRLVLLLAGAADLVEVVTETDGTWSGRFVREVPRGSAVQNLILLLGEGPAGARERPWAELAIDSIDLALTPKPGSAAPGAAT